jgi:hypothetical protein
VLSFFRFGGFFPVVSGFFQNKVCCWGQVVKEEKSNEIKVIPEFLNQLTISTTVISIVAAGIQKILLYKLLSVTVILSWL